MCFTVTQVKVAQQSTVLYICVNKIKDLEEKLETNMLYICVNKIKDLEEKLETNNVNN